MKRRLKPRYVFEYVVLRAFAVLFQVLPYRAGLVLTWLVARFAFHVLRFRRGEAVRRIEEVFGGERTKREMHRIAWISFRNFLFNAVELTRVTRLTRAWFEASVDHEAAIRALHAASDGGHGAILAIPHMGNWDMAGVGVRAFGIPIFIVAGRQHNPLTDAYLNRMRGATGVNVIPRGDARLLRKVVRGLRQGQMLGIMTDLRSRREGVAVRFLGKTANVVGGMALFARQARVPILPAVATRAGWTGHRWRVFNPVVADHDSDKEEDWRRMTQEVLDCYERVIREEPEQYFWYNKRWVLFPYQPPAPHPP